MTTVSNFFSARRYVNPLYTIVCYGPATDRTMDRRTRAALVRPSVLLSVTIRTSIKTAGDWSEKHCFARRSVNRCTLLSSCVEKAEAGIQTRPSRTVFASSLTTTGSDGDSTLDETERLSVKRATHGVPATVHRGSERNSQVSKTLSLSVLR